MRCPDARGSMQATDRGLQAVLKLPVSFYRAIAANHGELPLMQCIHATAVVHCKNDVRRSVAQP